MADGPSERVLRARASLDGLSVGDAFGERFLESAQAPSTSGRIPPTPPWAYTDDTVMALSIVEVLERYGRIDQDVLARAFVSKHAADPDRGYGPGAHRLLDRIRSGEDWRAAASSGFGRKGSFGNGGAMRAAPIGAYFAGDPDRAAREARRAAEVTHAHPEGQAGAMAVAAAAAVAHGAASGRALLDAAIEATPPGATREGIERARALGPEAGTARVAAELGNGSGVSAQDTVPFTLWSASVHLGRFEDAMWQTVSVLGDCDTTCAIVGGLVVLGPTPAPPPVAWLRAREALETMAWVGVDEEGVR